MWLKVCSRGRRKEVEQETAPGPPTAPVSRCLQQLLSGQDVSHSIFINLTKQQPHQEEEHLPKSSAGIIKPELGTVTKFLEHEGVWKRGPLRDEEGAEMGAGVWNHSLSGFLEFSDTQSLV